MVCGAWLLRQPAFASRSFQLLRCSALGVRYASVGWQVSSHGRVSTTTGRIHYGSPDCSGYRIALIGNQYYKVHRLVAAAFLGPPPSPCCWQVNHLDGDRGKQPPDKSPVCKPQPRINGILGPSTRVGRTSTTKLSKAILWRPCGQEAWSFCLSQREAEMQLGLGRGSISKCLRGLARRASGDGVWYEFKSGPHRMSNARSQTRSGTLRDILESFDIIPNLMVSNHGRVSQASVGNCELWYSPQKWLLCRPKGPKIHACAPCGCCDVSWSARRYRYPGQTTKISIEVITTWRT